MQSFTVSGQLIDINAKRTYPAEIKIENGIIKSILELATAPNQYILPGFIDAHIHIESSMLVPTSFARVAVAHGTVATVSDPHEIANVNGLQGVEYMLENSKKTPFKFFFGAPSCVPATFFETAGAVLDSKDVETLLQNPDIWYLSEMMNYPGVLYDDKEVMLKIEAAKKVGKPVDGHAPGLTGADVIKYANAGITTDHECFTLNEALIKIEAGMHILIREGSAAKNYDALAALIQTHPDKVMFCSDDKHPDELVCGHINELVKRSLQAGYNLYNVLQIASINPVLHYKLPVGLLQIGDPADFIVIDSLDEFTILQTYISGMLVAQKGETLLPFIAVEPINNFNTNKKVKNEFEIKADTINPIINIIEAIEGQLITNKLQVPAKVENGLIVSDTERDILKITVVNRYAENIAPAVGFIKNFGLKQGAIASTVGHDCHNIISIGVDDESICAAVNALIDSKGGISVAANKDSVNCMPLEVAGLMSIGEANSVAAAYTLIDKKAKELGTTLKAPFMTLSFMALLVIPALKLSDKGLFDGNKFEFCSLRE